MTDAEHLALVDAVIAKRLAGNAMEEYSEVEMRFKGTSLQALYAIRATLQNTVAAANGGQLRLARITRL